MRLLILFLFPLTLCAQEVKLVSWNVFLRPSLLHDHQLYRVDSIATHLLRSDADVICLQETFHKRARKRLLSQLDSIYPYQIHPQKKGLFGTNSGLLLLSKHPIQLRGEVFFEKLIAADKLSSKGVQFAVVKIGEKQVFVCNTHLQAGTEEKYQEVRKTQYPILKAITDKTELVAFVLGDLNTDINDTTRYDHMLEVVGVHNLKPMNLEQGTANLPEQDLFPTESVEAQVLDYVLIRDSSKVKLVSSEIKCFQSEWKKGRTYLSDHNAVEVIIQF